MLPREVFSIAVALPAGPYATKNAHGYGGHRGGKKSPQFHELTKAVQAAAAIEMQRIGWVARPPRLQSYRASVVRYHATAQLTDASNVGAVEIDALAKIGVLENDKLARPWSTDSQYDPRGPDRVEILIVRLYLPPGVFAADETQAAPTVRSRSRRIPNVAARPAAAGAAALGQASLNGVPISIEAAMKLVRGNK